MIFSHHALRLCSRFSEDPPKTGGSKQASVNIALGVLIPVVVIVIVAVVVLFVLRRRRRRRSQLSEKQAPPPGRPSEAVPMNDKNAAANV